MSVHHAVREVEHDARPGRDAEPGRYRHRHVLIGDVVDSELLQDLIGHIGPQMIDDEADGCQDPHEEPVELSRRYLRLLPRRANVIDLLLEQLVVLVVLEVLLREIDWRETSLLIIVCERVVVLVAFLSRIILFFFFIVRLCS